MSDKNDSTKLQALKILFTFAFIYVLGWFITRTSNVLGYFAIAGALAYVLNPGIETLVRRKVPRTVAIIGIFMLFFGGITLAVVLVIPEAKKEYDNLVTNMPVYFDAVKALWTRITKIAHDSNLPAAFESLPQKIAANFQTLVSSAGKTFFNGIFGFFSGLAALVIVPILVYYFLSDGKKMKEAVMFCVPPAYRDETKTVLDKINLALGGFLRGQLKLCLAMGVLTWFSLAFVARLDNALIFGLIAGVTEFIPYLGPILALIGPLIFATTISGSKVTIVLILFLVIQLLEGNVLAPKIIGKDVGMHPAFIVFVLMAAGQLAGIPGMISAIPAAVVLKVLFEHFYIEKIIIPATPQPEPLETEIPASPSDDQG